MTDESKTTLEDVAAAAGVSTATVSRALRGSASVRPETAARVRLAAETLKFSISRSASSLATGKYGRVAVLMAEQFEDWFCGQVLDAVYPVLSGEGYDLVIYRVRSLAERARFFAELPARKNADALIVSSFALSAGEQEKLHSMGVPIVYLNQDVPGEVSVGVDDRYGTHLALGHLLALGHRDIAFVGREGGPGTEFEWSSKRRFEGFLAELEAAGIDSASQLVIREEAGPDQGDRLAAALMSARRHPTAAFVEDDGQAMALVRALSKMGVRVPEEVSIIGFDGQAAGEAMGLTTIVQPIAETGARAAKLAVALARGESVDAFHTVLAPRLQLRASTRRPV